MKKNEKYFNYLKKRSLLGYMYRKYILYPRLSVFLKGDVLDVGCGIGDMLAYCKNSIGVDVNPFNIEFCRLRGLDACLAPENYLPFDNYRFNSVVLDNVLEHIADPIILLSEIKRVMKPKAILLVGVPGIKGYASDSDHKVFYDETKLSQLAEVAGFRIKKSFYTPLWKSDMLSTIFRQYCIYTVLVAKD